MFSYKNKPKYSQFDYNLFIWTVHCTDDDAGRLNSKKRLTLMVFKQIYSTSMISHRLTLLGHSTVPHGHLLDNVNGNLLGSVHAINRTRKNIKRINLLSI